MSKAPQRLPRKEAVQPSTPQPKPKKETAQFDLASYSFDELLGLKKEIDNEVEARKAKEIEVLRAKVAESAQTLASRCTNCFDCRAERQTHDAPCARQAARQIPGSGRRGVERARPLATLDEAASGEGQDERGLPHQTIAV